MVLETKNCLKKTQICQQVLHIKCSIKNVITARRNLRAASLKKHAS